VLVRVDGPYGEEEDDPEYTKYPTLAMFAGGIGVRACFGTCPLD
jgi:NAD(P)H-flavin reductase